MSEPGLSVLNALEAFSSDASYAVAVVTAARNLKEKGANKQLKADVQHAEASARHLCEQAEPFICMTQSPCGTGSCKYAVGEFALISNPRCKGTTSRPQQFATGGSYSSESVLFSLTELRNSIVK